MMILKKERGINSYAEICDIEVPKNYEVLMLTKCGFRYIPHTEVREVDGEKSLLVKVDGLDTFAEICHRHSPDMNEIIHLINDIVDCINELKEYLLTPDNIVLAMDYLYFSEEENEFRFIYVPGNRKSFREQIKDLFEDIMRIYDHKDSEGVMYLYNLYSRFLNENFTPDMLINMSLGNGVYEDINENINEVGTGDAETIRTSNEEEKLNSGDKKGLRTGLKSKSENDLSVEGKTKWRKRQRNEYGMRQRSEKRKEKKEKKSKEDKKAVQWRGFVAAVMVIVVGLIFFGSASLKFTILGLLAVTIYTAVDTVSKREEEAVDESMVDYIAGNEEIYQKKYQEKKQGETEKEKIPKAKIENDKYIVQGAEERYRFSAGEMKKQKEVQSDAMERQQAGTSVLRTPSQDCISTLIPKTEGKELEQIYLIEGETKVGRQSKACDFVVDDPSVSRLHAVLDKHGEVVTVRDMGSTNGTFINEKKISEGEVMILSPGDVISLASVCYECL